VRLINLGEGTTLLAVARNADEPSDVGNGDGNGGDETGTQAAVRTD
jgi:DNA gyrase subunit A